MILATTMSPRAVTDSTEELVKVMMAVANVSPCCRSEEEYSFTRQEIMSTADLGSKTHLFVAPACTTWLYHPYHVECERGSRDVPPRVVKL